MTGTIAAPDRLRQPAGMQRFGWVALAIPAGVIALYAAAVLLSPGFGPPFVAERRATMPLALGTHLSGGLIALALGAWQFNTRLRQTHLPLHRWIGRTYVVAVLVGGSGALWMAPASQGGFIAHAGFGLLAVLWLAATIQAYRRIRQGDQLRHRRWMVRSYALTFAAVTLRIILPLELALGLPFLDAYQAVAWLCWVPNLVVAEWLILTQGARA